MMYTSVKRVVKEHVIILAVSFVAFASGPGIVHANVGPANPMVFTEPLSLSRGEITPGSPESSYLQKDQYCDLMLNAWGWSSCEGIDAVIVQHVPNADITVVETPNSLGYVALDDWRSDDREQEIGEIEKVLKEAMREQSDRIGADIEFIGWRTYPQLNERKKYLYYAIDVSWDGGLQTNIKATVFDRQGYIVFNITPIASDMSSGDIEELINDTLDNYAPAVDQSYSAFEVGDKVAAVGALGVLAGMLGVNYGKGLGAVVLAFVIAVAKKGAFLVLLPVYWVAKLFKR